MLLRLLLFILFLSAMNVFAQTPTIETGVPQTLARWRAANYSDVRYKLNLTLEKMSPTLKGTIEIRVKVRSENGEMRSENGSQISPLTSHLILDWRKTRGKEDLSSVTNVFVNGKSAKFEEINEHLIFKEGVKAGENVIKLDFTSPILTSGGAITRYVDKEDNAEYVYSLFVPSDASTAFPVFDQPDLKARFQLIITAPKSWEVVTNSRLNSQMNQDSTKILGFYETQPISTYVFAFAAGDFKVVTKDFPNESTGIGGMGGMDGGSSQIDEALKLLREEPQGGIYVRKSQFDKFKPHIKEVFQLNREAVKYLESYFDYKFPFPKYDLILIPEFPFGGMEHAGATFLREDRIIFPTEPTKNDFVTRANLIFHEAAHQWFGDTVTMRWFDDLWLKEGFAEFMAYKTLEKVMPEYNAWKIFYERNKQAAYLTDSTKGTTPIYQEIPNLASAKSAYGNIVYRKAPSFLRQAEFYLGEDKFQTAVRAFLKKHEFANAEWTDLLKQFEMASKKDLKIWGDIWINKRGVPIIRLSGKKSGCRLRIFFEQKGILEDETVWQMKAKLLLIYHSARAPLREGDKYVETVALNGKRTKAFTAENICYDFYDNLPSAVFPNYQDYGYGIFLLDEGSRDYVTKNIQNEKDDFLRTMMWGSLWDSVRETELAPKDYVELVVKNINVETDESTIQTLLGRVSTAMNYYLPDKQREELAPKIEAVLIDKMQNAPTLGQRITFYRAFLNIASTEKARTTLKNILNKKLVIKDLQLKPKDRFDIMTRLVTLNDNEGKQMVLKFSLEDTQLSLSDEERRYAFAAVAGIPDKEIKDYYFKNFLENKNISESYIESAFVPFNSVRHSELTLPYLERALAELPNLKRNRKIFFVNGWLAAFIGGQRSEQSLAVVNKFLADNPNLDKDLRLKILETVDVLERAVKIRKKFVD